jgi:hypothetical protein
LKNVAHAHDVGPTLSIRCRVLGETKWVRRHRKKRHPGQLV